jgi:hypothetical protein
MLAKLVTLQMGEFQFAVFAGRSADSVRATHSMVAAICPDYRVETVL